jgi:hypothetical protein
MKSVLRLAFAISLLSLTILIHACNNNPTPDYSESPKDRPIPEGNRSEDSTIYGPVHGQDSDFQGGNARGGTINTIESGSKDSMNSQKANDSLSGGRIDRH